MNQSKISNVNFHDVREILERYFFLRLLISLLNIQSEISIVKGVLIIFEPILVVN